MFTRGRQHPARERFGRVATSTVAVLAGVLAAATAAQPGAHVPTAVVTPAQDSDCGLRCSYSLDRPTTQRWAEFFRRWDKLSDVPAVALAQMLCATLPGRPASAACGAAVAGGAAYFVDQLNEADAIGGCLQFQLFNLPGFALVQLNAYDDADHHCVGRRH